MSTASKVRSFRGWKYSIRQWNKNSKPHNNFFSKVRLRVKTLQTNNSGLVVSLKTFFFYLRVPHKKVFQFSLRITLTFKWEYYQTGIYFCENYIFRLPKDCFSALVVHTTLDKLKGVYPYYFFLNKMTILKNTQH